MIPIVLPWQVMHAGLFWITLFGIFNVAAEVLNRATTLPSLVQLPILLYVGALSGDLYPEPVGRG